MPEVHSTYSPSASARWLKCSGSLHDCTPEDVAIHEENQDTTAADRGTLGHTMVEHILSGRWETAKGLQSDPLFDEDLSDDVDFCVSWVTDNVPSGYAADGITALEQRLESGLLDGFGGTMDVLRIAEGVAYIVDFKFGRGLVEAKDNTQLLCYALLVYEHYPQAKTFQVTILQGGEAKTVVYSREELDVFFQAVARAMVETYYEAGDHCQYCPLRYRCGTAAAHVFDEVANAPDLKEDGLPTPERIDEVVRVAKAAKLGKDVYEVASKLLKTWAKEGVHLGDEAKVTTTRKKKWSEFAEDALAQIYGDKAYRKTLKTPAQMVKENPEDDLANLIDTTPTQVLRLGKLPPEFD